MDCKQAEDLQLAVKYVLGELPTVQRDEYEDHYMDCPECAQDVYAAAAFTDTAREVFRQEGRSEAPERVRERGGWLAVWLRPVFAVPAFAVLLIALGYQSLVAVPRLKNAAIQASAPRVLQMYSLIGANAKGPKSVAFQVRAGEPLGLYVDVPVEAIYTNYAMKLEGPDGTTKMLPTVSSAEAQKTLTVKMTPEKAGAYKI